MRLIAALLFSLTLSVPAHALDSAARAAVVIDVTSGATLMEKNADQPLPPASMSKLMTLWMVFEAIRDGRLSLEDRLPVSERAWRMGGSKMFVKVGDRIKVDDLLHGVIVQSGNDACVVLAEGLAGTESAFAEKMNARAQEIGLTHSHFVNASGWPADGHEMSVRDLATLATRIVTEFPDFYSYFSERQFTWEGITQKNRNPLLALDIGADGMKTGHTEAAGYGLVASVKREDRRVIAVISGMPSIKERSVEAEKLVSWAFREFDSGVLFHPGDPVAEAEVWIGDKDYVGLTPARDVAMSVPVADSDRIRVRLRYRGPVPAPIEKGDEIAELVVEAPGVPPVAHPLVAAEDVGAGGVLARVIGAARLLIEGGEDLVSEAE